MNTTEALRAVIGVSGKSARAISLDMKRSETFVSSSLNQAERMNADMNASTVAGIANACGHVLALIPAGNVPDGAIVIDPPK